MRKLCADSISWRKSLNVPFEVQREVLFHLEVATTSEGDVHGKGFQKAVSSRRHGCLKNSVTGQVCPRVSWANLAAAIITLLLDVCGIFHFVGRFLGGPGCLELSGFRGCCSSSTRCLCNKTSIIESTLSTTWPSWTSIFLCCRRTRGGI